MGLILLFTPGERNRLAVESRKMLKKLTNDEWMPDLLLKGFLLPLPWVKTSYTDIVLPVIGITPISTLQSLRQELLPAHR